MTVSVVIIAVINVQNTGVYVLMFESIFKTFFKTVILAILLVVAFGLAFYMIFHQFDALFAQSPFANPFHSLMKTMTMTTGEMDYESIFHQSSGGSTDVIPDIPFPALSFILWIIFLILMPVLFANLLVGFLMSQCIQVSDWSFESHLVMECTVLHCRLV